MGASGEMFLSMRAEEMVQMYDSTFTKKEAQSTGVNLVKSALENGNVGKHELMSTITRLKAVIDSAEAELRQNLPHEKVTVMGVEFNPVNGGETLNLTEDTVYCQLKKDLDDRVDLLKLAQRQDLVLDAYGNEVPRVGTTPRKSSITIKF
jgi:hypothetical protein